MVSDKRSIFKRITGASGYAGLPAWMLVFLLLALYILLEGQVMAGDVFTITSSSNQELDANSRFQVPVGNGYMASRTWTPMTSASNCYKDLSTNTIYGTYEECVVIGTTFGNGLPSGRSGDDVSQCLGGNSDFTETCWSESETGVDMDGAFPGGTPVPLIPRTETTLTETWIQDPQYPQYISTYKQRVFNKFLSNTSPGSGTNCGSITNNNNDICNEFKQNFTQIQDTTNSEDPNYVDHYNYNTAFSINSLVDENGDLIGDVIGSATADVDYHLGAPQHSISPSNPCTWNFKFDIDSDNDPSNGLDGLEDNDGDWVPDGYTVLSSTGSCY